MASFTQIKRVGGIVLEILLGCFFITLLLVNWKASHPSADSSDSRVEPESVTEPARPASLIPAQGTTLIVQINGSISNTDLSFFGPRHVISGFRGDPNCNVMGPIGTRFYDVVTFANTSSSSQRIDINFSSTCGTNTYMAAYSGQFSPPNICTNYLAGAGLSGNVDWGFTVCPNSNVSST